MITITWVRRWSHPVLDFFLPQKPRLFSRTCIHQSKMKSVAHCTVGISIVNFINKISYIARAVIPQHGVEMPSTGSSSGRKFGLGVLHYATTVRNASCKASFAHISWWRHQMETLSALLPFDGKSTGHRCIPLTKSSDAELWCFLWSAPEQTVE